MISIIVPTLDRPESIGPLAANVADTTPIGRYSLVFVLDHADRESRQAVKDAEFCRYILCDGTYPAKTNAGLRGSNEEWVLPTADDVWFRQGWFEAFEDAIEPWVMVLGTSDATPITANGTHATMPIIRRSYIQAPGAAWHESGTVFHEGYHHGWVETETCQLAQHRKCWKFSDEIVIEHRHPDWGTREPDATDEKGNRRNKTQDHELFEARKRGWLATR